MKGIHERMNKIKPVLLAFLMTMCSLTYPLTNASAEDSLSLEWRQIQTDYAQAAVIHKLYQAFQHHDGEAMASVYHPDATFEDPAFGTLKGKEIGAMWKFLLELSQRQIAIRYSQVDVHNGIGTAHWDADYRFSLTGFYIDNHIDSRFSFKDGLIYSQQDHFDFHRWSALAIGLPGQLLGGTPFLKAYFQSQVRQRLADWMKTHP